jgi:hypothetical protein
MRRRQLQAPQALGFAAACGAQMIPVPTKFSPFAAMGNLQVGLALSG